MQTQKAFDFSFDSSKCLECGGKCCRGKAGFIWLSEEEIANIAGFLKVSVCELKKGAIKEINGKYSIKDVAFGDERVCFFFSTATNLCEIYNVRPASCKSFPFWKDIDKTYLEKECIGVY